MIVEPIIGPELDRLITALLNVTGTVHQVIEQVQDDGEEDGLEIIGLSAMRLRAALSLFAEHHTDEELEPITEFLGLAALLIAKDGGFDEIFYPEDPDQ